VFVLYEELPQAPMIAVRLLSLVAGPIWLDLRELLFLRILSSRVGMAGGSGERP